MSEFAYSPRLRTALLLSGTGTAGIYQAGVLKALTEAGVRIDVVAAHGPGVMTALCAGIDGGAKLWDPAGPWLDPRLRSAYRWRAGLRLAAWGLGVAGLVLLSPLVVLLLAGGVYVASAGAALASMTTTSEALVVWYQRTLALLFDPPILPTIMPRVLVLAMLLVAGVLVVSAVRALRDERSRRRLRGAFWWRLVGSPLDAREPGAALVETLWRLVRGASNEPRPAPAELGRRYVDMLADNFGQPGFREVLVAVHDLDARRDLVAAALQAPARTAFEQRRAGGGAREAEAFDLTGPARAHVVDFLLGALRLPIAAEPHVATFASESYWRGESHRLCDRPELTGRLIDELAAVGVEQVIVASPASRAAVAHGMRSKPMDLRGRVGEFVRSVETAVVADAAAAASARFSGVFLIRPDHNPIGPFDFGGIYDEGSDRRRTPAELMRDGYTDAYRQFIEPVVATGEAEEA